MTGELDGIDELSLLRVTESAAVAACRFRGRGDETEADRAAVDAMRDELNHLAIDGRVVIGEGERDEAPMLYIGEEVGLKSGGPEVDIALDPLEGTTLCAKNQPDALTAIALAGRGKMLQAPDVYMEKLAVGPDYPAGIIDLRAPIGESISALAKEKGVDVSRITACVMDRPRHVELIEAIRSCGASVRLIGDGDMAAIIHSTAPERTGIDLYAGIGGAPEGVLSAAALRCLGGWMQGRLILDSPEKVSRAAGMGIGDPERIYELEEMASGDVMFAATGVTGGATLDRVRFERGEILTHSLVMLSSSRTVREVRARHRDPDRFA